MFVWNLINRNSLGFHFFPTWEYMLYLPKRMKEFPLQKQLFKNIYVYKQNSFQAALVSGCKLQFSISTCNRESNFHTFKKENLSSIIVCQIFP